MTNIETVRNKRNGRLEAVFRPEPETTGRVAVTPCWPRWLPLVWYAREQLPEALATDWTEVDEEKRRSRELSRGFPLPSLMPAFTVCHPLRMRSFHVTTYGPRVFIGVKSILEVEIENDERLVRERGEAWTKAREMRPDYLTEPEWEGAIVNAMRRHVEAGDVLAELEQLVGWEAVDVSSLWAMGASNPGLCLTDAMLSRVEAERRVMAWEQEQRERMLLGVSFYDSAGRHVPASNVRLDPSGGRNYVAMTTTDEAPLGRNGDVQLTFASLPEVIEVGCTFTIGARRVEIAPGSTREQAVDLMRTALAEAAAGGEIFSVPPGTKVELLDVGASEEVRDATE